jgi:hypothetical protein
MEQFRQYLGERDLNPANESDQLRNYCFNKITQRTGNIANAPALKMNASSHGVSLEVELVTVLEDSCRRKGLQQLRMQRDVRWRAAF